jgi:hypothetical protein
MRLRLEAKENWSCSRESSLSGKEVKESEGFCNNSMVTNGIKSFKEQIKPCLDTHKRFESTGPAKQ